MTRRKLSPRHKFFQDVPLYPTGRILALQPGQLRLLGLLLALAGERVLRIGAGVLANMFVKAAVAGIVGAGRFRWLALAGLGVLAAASGLGLWIGANRSW